jgi:hypothetical protein
MDKTNLLKFKADIIKRYYIINYYNIANTDKEKKELTRFVSDHNINTLSHFIINNYRRELSFNYLSWKVINAMSNRKIAL